MICVQGHQGWLFCNDKSSQSREIIRMCRQMLGRSHGPESAWHVGIHETQDNLRFKSILVKDPDLSLQLRLMFCEK